MLDQLHRAESARHDATDQGLALVINMLQLWTTICRSASSAPSRKRREYEARARKALGKAFVLVCRCEMTPAQDALFQTVFRDLTACLPIRPLANVIPIDTAKRTA